MIYRLDLVLKQLKHNGKELYFFSSFFFYRRAFKNLSIISFIVRIILESYYSGPELLLSLVKTLLIKS